MSSWATFLLPYVALITTVWIAYWDVLSYGKTNSNLPWVSDDIAGIKIYRGDWKDPDAAKPPEQWIVGPLNFHRIFRHLRWLAGRMPNPNINWRREKQLPYLPNPAAHHRLQLWLFCGIAGLFYTLLNQLVGTQVAFLATLLWIVHPIGAQTVGWISGIGYVSATFCMLVGLNIVLIALQLGWMATPLGTLGSLLLFSFFQWISVELQFTTAGVPILLMFLHYWPFAILSGLISIYGCANTLREAVTLRARIFKDQQMEKSTYFHPKKLIVVLKTLYYNMKLAFWPKRMGLYHTFCYHYELPYVEQEDRYGYLGLGMLFLCLLGLWKGSFPIQLGVIWFISFVILFLNWITANQFVVDRYVWLPSAGICLVAAFLLPMVAVVALIGIALCRLWIHLPTYESEEKFYLSNIANFPTSEVAYGNLGVTQTNQGFIPSSIENWVRGIMINPEYDVCWYNLSSCFLMRGPLNPNYFPSFYSMLPKEVLEMALSKDVQRSHIHIARFCLQRAVSSRTCHFPKMWEEQLLRLDQELSRPIGVPQRSAVLIKPMLTAAVT